MTEKKNRLKPSMLRREDLRGVPRRARKVGDRLAEAKSGRVFSDSTGASGPTATLVINGWTPTGLAPT